MKTPIAVIACASWILACLPSPSLRTADSELEAGVALDTDAGVAEVSTETVIEVSAPGSDATEETVSPSPWGTPVPLQIADGLPVINGTVDASGPLPFVVDTLSQVIFVHSEIVDTIGYTEANVTVGPHDLGLISVKGRDLTPDAIFTGFDLAGLLGHGYLTGRVTILDYRHRLAYLEPEVIPQPLPPLPGHEASPAHLLRYALPNLMAVLRPTIGSAGEVALLADTSSRISVVYRRVFDAVDDGTLPRLRGYRYVSKYGEEAGFVTRLPSWTLATESGPPLVVPGVTAVVLPDDNHLVGLLSTVGVNVEGFIGANIWERFAVGVSGHPYSDQDVDHRALVLWGDGAAPGDVAGRWTRVGLELAWRAPQVVVEMVYEGTTAAAAGVLVGDVLIAVDGAQVSGLQHAREALRGVSGEALTLTLTGTDGANREAHVTVEELLP